MPRPKAYSLPVTAPFDQWNHLEHDGRSVCRAPGSVCVNLPATTFQEGNETLEAVLQARPVRQAMIVDNHATTMRLFAAWRDSSCTLKARRSAPREALS